MNPPTSQITPLFAVPLAQFKHPNAQALCSELRTLFLAREDDQWRNEIRRPTQAKEVFESRFDLFTWSEPSVVAVREFCHRSLNALLAGLGQITPESDIKFDYHAWFHVTRDGGFQGLHNHQNASWSGIFCVDPGDHDPDNPRNGVVRFHDPKGGTGMFADAANRKLPMPFNNGVYEVHHQPGTLTIFPSYLYHEIFPYRGQRERIVVAFNSWAFEKAGG